MLDLDTAFCHALLKADVLSIGHISALLPQGISTEGAFHFGTGGLLERSSDKKVPYGQSGTPRFWLPYSRLAFRVMRLTHADQNCCSLSDDAQSRWSDADIRNQPDIVHVGEDICYLVTGTNDEASVRKTLNASNLIWHGLTAICYPPRLPTARELSDAAALTACLLTVRELHAIAYDGEGYVTWSRHELTGDD